ncbi:MAG: protein phosphatase 2C domain-containing protein [Bacteroidales bacterium]|nr:protein phosphatase 2C domain-containing protein [Bacteroidales bacterium]
MDIIEKHLKKIIPDEKQLETFLEKNETKISEFLIKLWDGQSQSIQQQLTKDDKMEECVIENISNNQTVEQTKEQQTVEATISIVENSTEIQQTQPDMQKFDSGTQTNKEKAKTDVLDFQIKNKQIVFPNGKVNQEYCVDFNIEKLDIPEIDEVFFEGLEAIGLGYSSEEKQIKGIPNQAGDHKIEMKFRRKDWKEGKPLLSREVMFIINPDPKSLWKNIPTPTDIEYYKPDSDKAFIKVETKKEGVFLRRGKKNIVCKDMLAASQRGRSHAIEGKPRDDDFALYFDKNTKWYIMVVADGAGSAPFSRKGSEIACQTVINVCKEKIVEKRKDFIKFKSKEKRKEIGTILQEIISNAIFQAHKEIEIEAKEKGKSIKDYSTTLLVSLCKKFEYGWFVGAWWVGDGGIGIYRKDPPYLKILGTPDGGEFAGQTRFLTMPEIIKKELYIRMHFDIVEGDFTALILMTDGVTDSKFETDANLNKIEKWDELWDDLNGNNEDKIKVDFSDDNEQLSDQLLEWLNFWSKGNHDDRTIAILF